MIQNTGYRLYDTGYMNMIQDTDYTDYRIQNIWYRIQGTETGYRKQDKDIDIEYRIQNTRYRLHETGSLNCMQWV